MVGMQRPFPSPSFGYALFFLKSAAPPGITLAQIYCSSLLFPFLQAVGLAISMTG